MTNTVQPARPVKLKHLIAGSVALLAILAVMGIPILYGLRKVGLIHVGGVVESVASDRDAYDPANPLTIKVGVEPNRGLDRYAKVEIRARVFVGSGRSRREIAVFRQIPAGRSLSNTVRVHPGAVVTLEADSLDAQDLAAMREAGEIHVVVDEFEGDKCVDDAVGEFRVPVKFTLLDAIGHVFASTPVAKR
jgi:hypothetical protein